MTPYFTSSLVTLYHGDCREIFPKLGIRWADLILADPPYGDTSLGWDRRVKGWLDAVELILSTSGSLWCFGSLRHFLAEAGSFRDWKLAQEVVWEKHNGSSLHSDRFKRVHELAAHFYLAGVPWSSVYRNPVKTNDATKRTVRRKGRPPHTGEGKIAGSTYVSQDGGPRLMRSVIRVRSCHGHALHPTQKPVGILLPLIEFSCPPGGTVAVPFAGVGSELEAARRSGRQSIGVELNERYCELAARRLEQGFLPLNVS
jgi:site-specific DNA-methyltransferase (adenine-specific)